MDSNSSNNINAIEQKLRIEREFKSGAGWFYWIAGLSLINSVIVLFEIGGWNFVFGLGITQIVDGISIGLSAEFESVVIKGLALAIDFIIAGIFILFGVFANKRHQWAFIVGMALYALDTIVFILVQDIFSILFHVFALYFIFRGFKASKQLTELEKTQENGDSSQSQDNHIDNNQEY